MSNNAIFVKTERFGLMNKLIWSNLEDVVEIERSIVSYTNNLQSINNYTDITNNLPTTGNYEDFNIEMRKTYKYVLKIGNPVEDENGVITQDKWNVFIHSYPGFIFNTNVTYSYNNNSFDISWNALDTSEIITDKFDIKYQLRICLKSNNDNLILFDDITTTNFTLNNNAQGINEQGNAETFTITSGLYFFYITPKLTQTHGTLNGDVKIIPNSDIKSNGNFIPPQFKLEVLSENPSDFKITSNYTNGKITFNWSLNNIQPNNYKLIFTNTDLTQNNTITIDNIPENINTYTLDNSDLTDSNAYKPGNYSVSLSAVYNTTIEGTATNLLYFTIPETDINFTKKLLDLYGNITTNVKNGVSGIQLDWNKLGYATYYKINVKQYDENLDLKEPNLDYIIAHPKNSIKLAWNFPDKKSKFEFRMSYTTETISPVPDIEDENALGEDYLGNINTNYPVEFIPISNNLNLGNLNLNITAALPPGYGE
tara:strand:- start:17077 stop:18522 length:1446 start_codon:yes stop_codon:yes gene_type:complete